MTDMDIRHGISKAEPAPILHTYYWLLGNCLPSVSFTSIRLREGHRHSGNRKPETGRHLQDQQIGRW